MCPIHNFRFADERSLQQNANNQAVWQNLQGSFPHPFSMNDSINWISINEAFQKSLNLGITINDQVVGGIGPVQQTNTDHLNAEIGYWLGEPFEIKAL